MATETEKQEVRDFFKGGLLNISYNQSIAIREKFNFEIIDFIIQKLLNKEMPDTIKLELDGKEVRLNKFVYPNLYFVILEGFYNSNPFLQCFESEQEFTHFYLLLKSTLEDISDPTDCTDCDD